MKKEIRDFLKIGITLPGPHPDGAQKEAETIIRILEKEKYDFFHIRKPHTDIEYVLELMRNIPKEYHKRLTLHSHYDLVGSFDFGGVHLKDFPYPKLTENKRLSKSFHSLEEINDLSMKGLSYAFLSPVFDSISKTGYLSNFNLSDKAVIEKNQQYRIIALGGVRPENFRQLSDSKFAGAALLGYLWNIK